MSGDELIRNSVRDWLMRGGAGFEGTPESSTFSFDGVVEIVEGYMQAFFANVVEVKIRKDTKPR